MRELGAIFGLIVVLKVGVTFRNVNLQTAESGCGSNLNTSTLETVIEHDIVRTRTNLPVAWNCVVQRVPIDISSGKMMAGGRAVHLGGIVPPPSLLLRPGYSPVVVSVHRYASSLQPILPSPFAPEPPHPLAEVRVELQVGFFLAHHMTSGASPPTFFDFPANHHTHQLRAEKGN